MFCIAHVNDDKGSIGKSTTVGATLRVTVRMRETEDYFASPKSEEVVYTVKEISAQDNRELVGALPKDTPLSGNLPEPGSYNPFVYMVDRSEKQHPYMAYFVGEVNNTIQVKIGRLTLTETTYEIVPLQDEDLLEYVVLSDIRMDNESSSSIYDDVWDDLFDGTTVAYTPDRGISASSDQAILYYDEENSELVVARDLFVIVRLQETDTHCHSEGIKLRVGLPLRGA